MNGGVNVAICGPGGSSASRACGGEVSTEVEWGCEGRYEWRWNGGVNGGVSGGLNGGVNVASRRPGESSASRA